MHSTNIDATDAARPADDTPTCPGCHFACRLDSYQCGKGKRFLEIYRREGTLPERSGGPSNSPSAEPNDTERTTPPLADRLAMGFGMLSRVINDLCPSTKMQEMVLWLDRSNGFMARRVLAKRMQMSSSEELDEVIASACQAGLVTPEEDVCAGNVMRLTKAGVEEAARVKAEKSTKLEAFFAPLTTDEQRQLDSLLHRIIKAHKAQGRNAHGVHGRGHGGQYD